MSVRRRRRTEMGLAMPVNFDPDLIVSGVLDKKSESETDSDASDLSPRESTAPSLPKVHVRPVPVVESPPTRQELDDEYDSDASDLSPRESPPPPLPPVNVRAVPVIENPPAKLESDGVHDSETSSARGSEKLTSRVARWFGFNRKTPENRSRASSVSSYDSDDSRSHSAAPNHAIDTTPPKLASPPKEEEPDVLSDAEGIVEREDEDEEEEETDSEEVFLEEAEKEVVREERKDVEQVVHVFELSKLQRERLELEMQLIDRPELDELEMAIDRASQVLKAEEEERKHREEMARKTMRDDKRSSDPAVTSSLEERLQHVRRKIEREAKAMEEKWERRAGILAALAERERDRTAVLRADMVTQRKQAELERMRAQDLWSQTFQHHNVETTPVSTPKKQRAPAPPILQPPPQTHTTPSPIHQSPPPHSPHPPPVTIDSLAPPPQHPPDPESPVAHADEETFASFALQLLDAELGEMEADRNRRTSFSPPPTPENDREPHTYPQYHNPPHPQKNVHLLDALRTVRELASELDKPFTPIDSVSERLVPSASQKISRDMEQLTASLRDKANFGVMFE